MPEQPVAEDSLGPVHRGGDGMPGRQFNWDIARNGSDRFATLKIFLSDGGGGALLVGSSAFPAGSHSPAACLEYTALSPPPAGEVFPSAAADGSTGESTIHIAHSGQQVLDPARAQLFCPQPPAAATGPACRSRSSVRSG